MKQINLKDIYPYYTEDQYVLVTDEVADLILESENAEKNQERRERRYRANVPLDRLRFFTKHKECVTLSADDEFEQQETQKRLYDALSRIPSVQAHRIVAYYVQEKTFQEIADEEGVKKLTIYVSIRLGIRNLKKILNFSENRTNKSPIFDLYNEGTFSFPGET